MSTWILLAVLAAEPLAPSDAIDAFVADPSVKIECVAAEPQIVDPIAARFDEHGRLWVVEMRDYPTGPVDGQGPQGTIKVLRDRDGDGIYEHATTFADQLIFATGVQPWRGGVIVTLAGSIEYMIDRNGDDVCDEREVWFQGFAEENTQLRANHPTLGPDGRVYIANGLRNGKVVAVGKAWSGNSEPVPLAGRDFVFDPRGGWYGSETGGGQFGMSVTDHGERVICSNRNPCDLVAIPAAVIQRDTNISSQQAVWNMSLTGTDSHLKPLVQAWTTSNLHAGQFTAACGVYWYGGTTLPDTMKGSVFACDPTGCLVQRQIVTRAGPVWNARRVEGENEFLASRDPWFRGVDLTGGPDGSLYVVDMYRAVIEHPDFVPVELKKRPDERWGNDRGRIYRISSRDFQFNQANLLDWDSLTIAELVQRLDHADRWVRETAGRCLWEKSEPSPAVPGTYQLPAEVATALTDFASDPVHHPGGRSRALFLLASHGQCSNELIEVALRDSEAGVRAVAVRVLPDPLVAFDALLSRAKDEDAAVRFQVAMRLGGVVPSDEKQRLELITALDELSKVDAEYSMSRTALGAVTQEFCLPFLSRICERADAVPVRRELAKHLALRCGQGDDPAAALTAIQSSAQGTDWAFDLANQWTQGLASSRRAPATVLQQGNDTVREAWIALLEQALTVASASETEESLRAAALQLLRYDTRPEVEAKLWGMLESQDSVSPRIRLAIIETLAVKGSEKLPGWLLENLAAFSPEVRRRSVDLLMTRSDWTKRLLTALEMRELPRAMIDLVQAQRLTQSRDAEIQTRASELLAASGQSRKKVIDQYSPICSQPGNAKRGEAIFKTACSNCHRIGEVGRNLGPDISDSRTKTIEQLLASILDPDAAIDAGFLKYTVLTTDGRVLDGLLIDETAERISLRPIEGEPISIPRQDIESIKSAGVSLMPTGFETTLPPAAMRDLIAYIKQWRYLQDAVPADVKAIK